MILKKETELERSTKNVKLNGTELVHVNFVGQDS